MIPYYSRRAREYEAVYAKPERQADLAVLHGRIPALLAGRRVLELACGTGYWTRRIAPVAASLLATDASGAMLAEARRNCAAREGVSFRHLDAYALAVDLGTFDAVFTGFFWSHVERAALPGFLASLAAACSGGRAVFVDNRYAEGSSTPPSRTTAGGDAYQLRTLADGSAHEVLKNFPSADEIRAALGAVADEVEVAQLNYYWLAWGTFRAP